LARLGAEQPLLLRIAWLHAAMPSLLTAAFCHCRHCCTPAAWHHHGWHMAWHMLMGWHAHQQDLMHRSSHRMPRNARHRASFFLLKK
jgi:hypothetical protein